LEIGNINIVKNYRSVHLKLLVIHNLWKQCGVPVAIKMLSNQV